MIVVGSRAQRLALGCALLWLASGCAARRAEPPPEGDTCDAGADCALVDQPDASCGFVRLCVAGRCEQLDDAGMPLSRTVRCDR